MTEVEKYVECVNANLPDYTQDDVFGGSGCPVHLSYLSRFDTSDPPDEPDPIDRIILAGQEIAAMRQFNLRLTFQLTEKDIELKRRGEIISKLVLALESSNQIAAKLTDILAKSVK